MTRNGHFLLTALLLTASMGCTDRDAQKQHIGAAEEAHLAVQAQAGDAEAARRLDQIQKVRAAMPQNEPEFTPDTPAEYEWSADRLKNTISLAEKGDVAAVKALYDYYGFWGDREGVDRWEEWLVRRNDDQAMLIRADKRFTQASDLPDTDDRKLAKLKQADDLMRKWRAANGRGDGLEVAFHQKIIAEIERLNALRATQ